MKFNPQTLFLLLSCFILYFFASCEEKKNQKENINKIDDANKNIQDSLKNLTEKIDTNRKIINNSDENITDKLTEKPIQKLDSTVIMAKITKKWQITGNYWVSSIETFNNNENYFIDIKKDGSYTLKALLEDANINEIGEWKLQNPKIKFRKFEETDPKDAGVPIEDNEEILVLMPKNPNKEDNNINKNKERLFLFNFEEKQFAFNALTRPSGFFAK